MVRPIERIEREIAGIEEAIRAIAQEMQSAYTNYLTALGQAVGQQLIQATYHLCTRGYAENFLKLSLKGRQQLQQGIRKLGQQAALQLLIYISTDEQLPSASDAENSEPMLALADEKAANKAQLNDLETILGDQIEDTLDGEEDEEDEKDEKETESETDSAAVHLSFPGKNSSDPIELARWQQYLELMTQQMLSTLSRDANLLLQKAGILPKKLPEVILAGDRYSPEPSAEVMPGPPNLLNLVIEVENDPQTEDSSLRQIVAINLRLGEIEFADTTLSSLRKQIRNILGQLNKLGREYQNKQRERAVAQADAAWRASWFED